MATPAEVLLALSPLPSGTPAEHLLAITTGGGGTGFIPRAGDVDAEVTAQTALAAAVASSPGLEAAVGDVTALEAETALTNALSAHVSSSEIQATITATIRDVEAEAPYGIVVPSEAPAVEANPSTAFNFWSADQIVGVPDGDPVLSVPNTGTLGLPLTPDINAPVMRTTAGPNGGPAISFEVDDSYLQTATYATRPQPFVACAVFKVTSLAGTQVILHGPVSAANPTLVVQFDGSLSANAGVGIATGPGLVTADTWLWAVIEYNGVATTIQTNTVDIAAKAFAGNEGTEQFRLGANVTGGNDLSGMVKLVGMWDDGTQRANVVSLLRALFPGL
jgi:hypothetical protein